MRNRREHVSHGQKDGAFNQKVHRHKQFGVSESSIFYFIPNLNRRDGKNRIPAEACQRTQRGTLANDCGNAGKEWPEPTHTNTIQLLGL